MSRLIDADALTERLNEYANDDWNVSLGGVFTDAVDTCLDFVENAPTIEAVPVVEAEWISTGDAELDNIYSGYKCSACGYMICGNAPNFCGGCGAKMKGGAK